ncbi:MAG: APC family permease [Oscillospiraceae bacterium]
MAQTQKVELKDVKKTLGRMDLMSIAVGQIIGAGVMTMSIKALGMTGRSVNIAFVVAAVFTVFGAFPAIFASSVLRMRGGLYTQAVVFVGEKFAGFYTMTTILAKLSMSMFAVGIVDYAIGLIPGIKPYKIAVTFVVMTAFFILNFFGTAYMAKVQSLMFYFLVAALIMFTLFGLPKVHWAGYFGNTLFDKPLMSNGIIGVFEAASYLTFATGGATVILSFSADAINPQKDFPFVIIVSTLAVAVLYAFMATCIGGIMPPEEVLEAGTLGPIAKMILPTPLYYFFMIGGAMFALATTLNSSIASALKPFVSACEDGWLPSWVGQLHPKTQVAWVILIIFYLVNAPAILFGLDVGSIGKWVLVIGNVTNFFISLGVIRLPKLFPEAWAKSPFHVSNGVLTGMLCGTAFVILMQAYLNLRGLAMPIIIINIATFIVAFIYTQLRYKSGKVNVKQSYELA